MLALLKNVFRTVTSPRIIHHQQLSSFGLICLFSTSQTRSKFTRPQPTDAELLEMSPKLRSYYENRHDPVLRQKRNERQRLIQAKLRQQRLDDPEFKQRWLARWRKEHETLQSKERHRIRVAFRRWLTSIPESQREAYSWKIHLPMMFSKSQCMTCSVCSDYPTKARLWWKRLDNHSAPGESNAKQYTCHSCYMDQEMSEILPRGLEDHVIGSRKKWPMP